MTGDIIKIKHILSKKNDGIFHHFDQIKGFKGTFVNRIFPSLHRRLLEIKLTVTFRLNLCHPGLIFSNPPGDESKEKYPGCQ